MSTRAASEALLAFALAVSTLVSACQARPPALAPATRNLVRLADGRRLNLNCSGEGSPTVILEGGYGATSEAWVRIQPAVAETTRVCSYDRAGYGLSDPGPLPRDGLAIATDLDHLLWHANIRGPFIVVGHSAGALYVRLFANLRPHDVVGMVLVDPSVEHQDQRFAKVFGPGAGSVAPLRARALRCLLAAQKQQLSSTDPQLVACNATPKTSPANNQNQTPNSLEPWQTEISELDTLWGATSDEIDAGRKSYADMPLIVLTADGTYAKAPQPAATEAAQLWWRLHSELAAKSTRGSNQLVTNSSHLMMFDRADAIIAAIRSVIAQTRERQAPATGARDANNQAIKRVVR